MNMIGTPSKAPIDKSRFPGGGLGGSVDRGPLGNFMNGVPNGNVGSRHGLGSRTDQRSQDRLMAIANSEREFIEGSDQNRAIAI